MKLWLNAASALLVAALVSPPAALQAAVDDTLATARDLYSAAEYEQSLAVLDRLQGTVPAGEDRLGVEQYRAYCLMALGRTTDAEQAIATIVNTDPLYRASGDVSPRVQTAFRDVRKRMLPGLVQSQYAQAKASFDNKQFADAAKRFTLLLEVMADPDLAAVVGAPPFSDLRMLASGFKDLAVQAIPPPPIVAKVAPAAAVPPPPPPPPSAPKIFASDDALVQPPIPLKQDMPSFPAPANPLLPGVLEVIVNEAGEVESVTMRVPINAKYDGLITDAARKWKYRPAMREGAPVKYRKLMQVTVQKN
jgi:hypothetical protein